MKQERFYRHGEKAAVTPYQYRACGLEGIYLLNGYELANYDGEECVTVHDIDGLHLAIGRHLVLHRKVLAPREIRFLRNTMDMTQGDLASLLGNTSQSVARWEKNDCDMPGAADKLLRLIFFARTLNQHDEDDAAKLRELVASALAALDDQDEVRTPCAQFRLDANWAEQERDLEVA